MIIPTSVGTVRPAATQRQSIARSVGIYSSLLRYDGFASLHLRLIRG
jgi:hypothetical protein